MSDAQMGRPSKFSDTLVSFILYLAKDGKTDAQISEIVGIHESTLNNWKNRYPDFFESLKEARETPDDEVEKSLFQRALGYTCKETKIVVVDKQPVPMEVDKHYPPDTVACIFWLKNRRPDRWREKIEEAPPKDTTIKLAYPGKDGK